MGKIVLGIIENNGRILIGRVKEEKLDDFGGIQYVFPGGKPKQNELIKEAVVREAKEETGLNVVIIAEIGHRVHPVTKKETYYFHCTSQNKEAIIDTSKNDDIDSWKWVPINQLEKYMPVLSHSIKNHFSNRKI